MKYNNFQEFMNELKGRVNYATCGNGIYAWFYLRKDGWVSIDYTVTLPVINSHLFKSRGHIVHPSFAWGIYQLMSNLNAMQQR